MFPQGAVSPDNVVALVEKTRDFLREKPVVKHNLAFSLQESMDQTLRLYHSALEQKSG